MSKMVDLRGFSFVVKARHPETKADILETFAVLAVDEKAALDLVIRDKKVAMDDIVWTASYELLKTHMHMIENLVLEMQGNDKKSATH